MFNQAKCNEYGMKANECRPTLLVAVKFMLKVVLIVKNKLNKLAI